MPQSRLGLIEAGTSSGMYEALAQLVADKQKADLLKQQEEERVQRRALEGRRQTEDERRNRRTEGFDERRVVVGESGEQRAVAGEGRTAADWARQNKERDESRRIIEGMRPALKTSLMLESYGGPKRSESEIQTAEERGTDTGRETASAWGAGVGPTEAAKLGMLDASALKRITWNSAANMREIAATPRPTYSEPLVPTVGPDGRTILTPRSEAGGREPGMVDKPATAASRKVLAYWEQMKEASDALDLSAPAVAKMGLGGQARMQYAPNWLQSADGRAYTNAQRAFTDARLRQRSGAAIPNHEYENDARTFFVQPGDTPADIARKNAARQKLLDAVAYEAGDAYHEAYGEKPKPAGGGAPAGGGTSPDDQAKADAAFLRSRGGVVR